MSHWTIAKVKLVNPNLQLLRQALEALAAELGSRVVEDFVVVGWRGSLRCPLAVPLKLPYGNGYGVYVDEQGEVRVVADDHGAPLRVEEFAARLQQYYVALAVATAARSLGFTVEVVHQTRDAVVLDLSR